MKKVVPLLVLSTFLAGCTDAGRVIGLPAAPSKLSAATRQSWMAAGAASGDLLYISDVGYGAVFVYTYSPIGMKFVGILTEPQNPGAMCVDKQQNVWILGGGFGGKSFAATEYAHGGTPPIAVL